MVPSHIARITVVAVATVSIAACGSDTAPSASEQHTTRTASQTQGTQSTPDTTSKVTMSSQQQQPHALPSDVAKYASVSGACGSQPTLSVHTGTAAPSTLQVADVCQGPGSTVAAGATVTAHYTGIGLQTGQVFDSSWSRGEPIQFPLTGVIAGWSQGIPGMKVGGRRLLVIPGDLAYGAYPPPTSGIKPNETLIFVVDIISSP